MRFLLVTWFSLLFCQGYAQFDNSNWFWVSAAYGTPVITNTTYNSAGLLEIKAGGVLTKNLTLVGGLENTLRGTDSIPERFSPFLGPGFIFRDQRIFLSMHTGISYPFYRNAPEDYPQNPGLQSAIDLGVRLAPKITVGIGLSNHLAKDINAFTFRFWLQINSE